MHDHHRQTIYHLRQRFEAHPAILALIIIGSVARGDSRPESDVDFCVVVAADNDHRRPPENNLPLYFNTEDVVVPPGEEANGRAITIPYLHDVADHGSEPFRYAFAETLLVFAREPLIADLVQRCAVYPEHEHTEKLMRFASQIPAHFSFLEFGHYSQTTYVLYEAAVKLVLFGGRLLLTHNRMLYPGRKGFMRQLAKAPDKPAGIIDRADDLLRKPSIDRARAFFEPIMNFADWPQPPEGIGQRFWHDSVAQWERGWCPIEDC